jgi:Protein of unknown function (DUF1168)
LEELIESIHRSDLQVRDLTSSTAGANSGEFFVYRRQKWAEAERQAKMEQDAKK